jgi:hypothetical protein
MRVNFDSRWQLGELGQFDFLEKSSRVGSSYGQINLYVVFF